MDKQTIQKMIDNHTPVKIKRSNGEFQQGLVTEISTDGRVVTLEWPDPKDPEKTMTKQARTPDFLRWQASQKA